MSSSLLNHFLLGNLNVMTHTCSPVFSFDAVCHEGELALNLAARAHPGERPVVQLAFYESGGGRVTPLLLLVKLLAEQRAIRDVEKFSRVLSLHYFICVQTRFSGSSELDYSSILRLPLTC